MSATWSRGSPPAGAAASGGVLLTEEVAEDEHGVDQRHRHHAPLQPAPRAPPASSRPARGHRATISASAPPGRAPRPAPRGRPRAAAARPGPARAGRRERPSQRERAADRHQHERDPGDGVRAGAGGGDRRHAHHHRHRRDQRPAAPPRRSRKAGMPAAARDAERLRRIEHEGVQLEYIQAATASSRSSSAAAATTRASAPAGAISSTEAGRPCSAGPQGSASAGQPTALKG